MPKDIEKPVPTMQPGDRMLRLREVMERTGLSKTSVYRLAGDSESDFPAVFELTKGARGWLESSITAWLESRKVAA